MPKVIKISEITQTLNFTEFDYIKSQAVTFRNSELGYLKSIIPVEELSRLVFSKKQKTNIGRPSFFTVESQIYLMILKSRYNLSDKDLIERLNSDIHFQLFCGVFISPTSIIEDYKIVSRIRTELSKKLSSKNMLLFQKIIAKTIKTYISCNELKIVMSDATCYESNMRYPTTSKLLWESIERVRNMITKQCSVLSIKQPRTKYLYVESAYKSYSKTRKRTYKKTRKIVRRELHLLEKLIYEYDLLKKVYKIKDTKRISAYYSVIKNILSQQKDLFTNKPVKGRIVSIDRPYIRPIVRGKETKAVEFGAKVNAIQVGGYNFIEHLDFNAFNEGIRVVQCIELHKILFQCKPRFFAGDAIYANNKNRVYCRENQIITNFVPKGRASKDEKERKVIRRELNIIRATTLEGSFGTEKQHYSLRKINARTKKNEILWILFGIHTANFTRLVRKLMLQEQLAKKAA